MFFVCLAQYLLFKKKEEGAEAISDAEGESLGEGEKGNGRIDPEKQDGTFDYMDLEGAGDSIDQVQYESPLKNVAVTEERATGRVDLDIYGLSKWLSLPRSAGISDSASEQRIELLTTRVNVQAEEIAMLQAALTSQAEKHDAAMASILQLLSARSTLELEHTPMSVATVAMTARAASEPTGSAVVTQPEMLSMSSWFQLQPTQRP